MEWRILRAVLSIGRPGRGGRGGERQMATTGYEKSEGWLFFAFVLLVIVGFFNVVLGLTMVAGDTVYVTARDPGPVRLRRVSGGRGLPCILGIRGVVAAFGVLARHRAPRWFAIVMATLAALAHLPVIFGPHPVYSFLVVLMAVLVIYGLAQ